jgi:hypothetical protein
MGGIVLKANIETLDVLAHQYYIDIFVAPSRHQGEGGTHVGVQI